MSGNPPPLDPLLQADVARRALDESKAQWGQVRTALTGQRDAIRGELTKGQSLAKTTHRTASDLRKVEGILAGVVSPKLERKAQALGLPADPIALSQKREELTQSLSGFSARLSLDPVTRNHSRMMKYLDALDDGDYKKARKLAEKDPPLWMRVFAPWKAQAMRNDRDALLAGVETYRRTKETIRAAEKLSDKIENSNADALHKALHSKAWQRLRAQPGIETALKASPELAVLMKYDPQSSGKSPTKKDLKADLLEARMEGVATGRTPPAGKDMARILAGLAAQVEAQHQQIKTVNQSLKAEARRCDRALREGAWLEHKDTTARVGEKGKRVDLGDALEKAREKVVEARRDVGRTALDGSPEERGAARERLKTLVDPKGDLARALSAAGTDRVSAHRRERIEAAALAAAAGNSLPKSTPGTSFLRTAFIVAAPGLERAVDTASVTLGKAWQGALSAMSSGVHRADTIRKERIEPSLA